MPKNNIRKMLSGLKSWNIDDWGDIDVKGIVSSFFLQSIRDSRRANLKAELNNLLTIIDKKIKPQLIETRLSSILGLYR